MLHLCRGYFSLFVLDSSPVKIENYVAALKTGTHPTDPVGGSILS